MSLSPDGLARAWCPAGTFWSEVSRSFGREAVALLVGAISVPVLAYMAFSRVDLSAISGAYPPPAPPTRRFKVALPFAIAGTLGAVGVWAGVGASHRCLTPSGILLRQGPLATTRVYKWSDVVAVIARCEREVADSGADDKVAILDLTLADGGHVPVRLSGPDPDWGAQFRGLQEALRVVKYRYTIDWTATESRCPHYIYREIMRFG